MGWLSFREKIKLEVVLSGSEVSEIRNRMAFLHTRVRGEPLKTIIVSAGVAHADLEIIANNAMTAARDLNESRAHTLHKEDSDLQKILRFIVYAGTYAPTLQRHASRLVNAEEKKAIRLFIQGVTELAVLLDDAIKRFMYQEIAFLHDLQTQKAALETTLAKLH